LEFPKNLFTGVGELISRVTILRYELPFSHVFRVIEELNPELVVGIDLMEP